MINLDIKVLLCLVQGFLHNGCSIHVCWIYSNWGRIVRFTKLIVFGDGEESKLIYDEAWSSKSMVVILMVIGFLSPMLSILLSWLILLLSEAFYLRSPTLEDCTLWPWTSYSTSLCLRFLISKVMIILHILCRAWVKMKCNNSYKVFHFIYWHSKWKLLLLLLLSLLLLSPNI